MADENIVTNIVANADFSGLIADVNKVTASLSKLQSQLIASDAKLANQVAVMNRSFSENLRRTGQFSTHFVTLTSDTEKFGKALDSGKLKLILTSFAESASALHHAYNRVFDGKALHFEYSTTKGIKN